MADLGGSRAVGDGGNRRRHNLAADRIELFLEVEHAKRRVLLFIFNEIEGGVPTLRLGLIFRAWFSAGSPEACLIFRNIGSDATNRARLASFRLWARRSAEWPIGRGGHRRRNVGNRGATGRHSFRLPGTLEGQFRHFLRLSGPTADAS
jgi:hypothetical protein